MNFVALLGYTFLAEPLMGLKIQSLVWTGAYGLYAVVAGVAWFSISGRKGTRSVFTEAETKGASVSGSLYLKWILLSGLPSAFLLAVTNLIVLEIGSFPLTWIAPLSLYLGSFIVTFRARGGMPSNLRHLWPEILMVALSLYLLGQGHLFISIITLILFFLICLVAHGTL